MGVSAGLWAETADVADKAAIIFLTCMMMMMNKMLLEVSNRIQNETLNEEPRKISQRPRNYLSTFLQHPQRHHIVVELYKPLLSSAAHYPSCQPTLRCNDVECTASLNSLS